MDSNYRMNASKDFLQRVDQPIFCAIWHDLPRIAERLLNLGVDKNSIDADGYQAIMRAQERKSLKTAGYSLLGHVKVKIQRLEEVLSQDLNIPDPVDTPEQESCFAGALEELTSIGLSARTWTWLEALYVTGARRKIPESSVTTTH